MADPLIRVPVTSPSSPLPHLAPLPRPRLLLRPAAFLKLQYLCQAAGTEVGGFGLSSAADPLVLDDILLVRQEATVATVVFDDDAVADLIDTLADTGTPPQRCSRVWVHTHPGHSASPSGTDERTFARSFGGCDFSVMLILARGGAWYARLQLVGPVKTAVEIPVILDWAGLPDYLQNTALLPGLVQTWGRELRELVSAPTGRAYEGLELIEDDHPSFSRGWWDEELFGIDDDAEAVMAEEEVLRDYLI